MIDVIKQDVSFAHFFMGLLEVCVCPVGIFFSSGLYAVAVPVTALNKIISLPVMIDHVCSSLTPTYIYVLLFTFVSSFSHPWMGWPFFGTTVGYLCIVSFFFVEHVRSMFLFSL